MKNRVLIIIGVVCVGIFSGLLVLMSISIAVQSAVLPIATKLGEISATLRVIDKKLDSKQNVDLTEVTSQLTSLQRRLASINLNGGNNAPTPPPQMPPSEDFDKVYDIPLASSYIHGKKDAPVTIVEFADLQCPFCARFHGPILDVLKAYPDKVKYIIKNFPLPFHPQSRPAAKAALAAGEQGKYYDMATMILEEGAVEGKYEDYAKKLGLDLKKFNDDLKQKDAQYEKILNDDMQLGSSIDVRGTPTFYLNGKKTMARDLASWKAAIDKL